MLRSEELPAIPPDNLDPTETKGRQLKGGRSIPDMFAAVVPLLVVLASVGAYVRFGHRPPPIKRSDEAPFVEQIKSLPVEAFAGQLEVAVEGVARPFRHVTIAAEVAGRIKFKSPACEEAAFITKGTLLLEIDPTDYELAVRRYTNELAQMENALKEWDVERGNTEQQIRLAKEDVALAEREVQRVGQLAGSKISTATELDMSQRSKITARNMLLQSENQLRLLDARRIRAISARDLQEVLLERASRDLERTKIIAPCDGTIVSENVEQDGYVQTGSSLVVINDTQSGEVICRLELDDMYWLWGTKLASSGSKADLANPYAFPRWPVTVEFPVQDLTCVWEGEMYGYGGAGIDASTRTVPCQVRVADPRGGHLIRPDGAPEQMLPAPPLTVGMYVTVRAQVTPYTKLLRLPLDALRAESTICVVRDGKLTVVPIKVAKQRKGEVLVFDPATEQLPSALQGETPLADDVEASSSERKPATLVDGDRVIVSPLATIREGMPVREVAVP